jgi:hypothetical protein
MVGPGPGLEKRARRWAGPSASKRCMSVGSMPGRSVSTRNILNAATTLGAFDAGRSRHKAKAKAVLCWYPLNTFDHGIVQAHVPGQEDHRLGQTGRDGVQVGRVRLDGLFKLVVRKFPAGPAPSKEAHGTSMPGRLPRYGSAQIDAPNTTESSAGPRCRSTALGLALGPRARSTISPIPRWSPMALDWPSGVRDRTFCAGARI